MPTGVTFLYVHVYRIFLNDFIKNPQTRNACTFLPLNISSVGSVYSISAQEDQTSQNPKKNTAGLIEMTFGGLQFFKAIICCLFHVDTLQST